MASSSSPEQRSGSLLEAVFTLAAVQMAGDATEGGGDRNNLHSEVMAAITALRHAPPRDHWNRGLLGGLRSNQPQVVEATVRAVIERLQSLSGDTQGQDRLMSAVLDACFLNLVGRVVQGCELAGGPEGDESRRVAALELASAELLRAVSRLLLASPCQHQHLVSRLLARARSIKHLSGRSHLARAVVELQEQLAAGESCDSMVVDELHRRRQIDLYTSPVTSESSLRAYLAMDRRRGLDEIDQELLRAYRILLSCQSKERAGGAILDAMANLIAWLDQLPQGPAERGELIGEVVQRTRVHVPWEELDLRICRHLEAHLELLPGAEHPEDLLRQLREKYDAAEGEEIFIRGLAVLGRLPLVRLRSQELIDLMLRPGRERRSAAVWQALLGLVERLLTGLADMVLTREALSRSEARRNRVLRSLLAHDQRLRDLLYRMATDEKLQLSGDAEVQAAVRENAWRVLLRCLPQDRVQLLHEGLVRRGEVFFFATVEEAAQAHQRQLWDVVRAHWHELIGVELQPEVRRARIESLARAFSRTRNFEVVQDDGNQPGLLLRLVLDDTDDWVRTGVEEAVVAAGYQLELQRERQRRELLRLRDELTASNEKIVELEGALGRLCREATETQVERAEHGLNVQELIRERDLCVTESWLVTADIQVDLEEVRAQLVEALARAQQQLQLLRGLQQRMHGELAQAQREYRTVQSLVHQQEQQEAEIQRLQREQQRAADALEAARRHHREQQSRLAGLQHNPPQKPADTGDAQRNQRAAADFRNRLARHQSEIANAERRIGQLSAEIRSCQHTINSCERGIAAAQAALQRLQAKIDETGRRIAALRQRITSLDRELRGQQQVCAAIRREIHRLRDEVQRIETRLASERRQAHSRLQESAGRIAGEQQALDGHLSRLHDLSQQLNSTGDSLDRQKTLSQRLTQGIDSGREGYDRIGGEADQQSAVADATGFSLQAAREHEVLEDQESLVHYVEGLHRVVKDRPMPQTRQDQQRRPRRTSSRQAT